MISRIVRSIRHNVVAWLALFVAMGGTSMAASHYLITSTRQIKPSVLRKLHGAKGAPGAKGTNGVNGARGPEGKEGKEGVAGKDGKDGAEGHEGKEGKEGGLIWRGEYSAGTTYKTKEVVYSAGSSWFAKKESKGQSPAVSPTYWELVAKEGKEGKEGTPGAAGVKGAEGQQGPQGEPGTSGVLGYAHVTAKGHIETGSASESFKSAVVLLEPEEEGGGGETGVFCISGLTVTPHDVQVTVDDNEYITAEEIKKLYEVATSARAVLGPGKFNSCPAETQITVETFEPVGTRKERYINAGFYIEIN